MRKIRVEERARLEVEFSARGKLAEEKTRQLETALARRLEEKEQTIVSLEARLKEYYSKATFRAEGEEERYGDEGGRREEEEELAFQTTTIRLG